MYFYRGEEREKEGEKHQCVIASQGPPTGDLACNPGMCPPDWESNWQLFGSQACAQFTSHTSQCSHIKVLSRGIKLWLL